MDKSTSQELNRMTVNHRLFGVVIITFLGCSALMLSAQEEVVDTDASTSTVPSTNANETNGDLDVEPNQDQFTKTYLQALSKEDFKAYMLNMDQYSKNDQDALCLEYQRRCSDDSKDYSSDLCPDDIEPTFGTADRDSDQVEDESDVEESQTMPQLIEQTVQVGSTVRANNDAEQVFERDPRIDNEKSERKNGRTSWRNKPKKPDFPGMEN